MFGLDPSSIAQRAQAAGTPPRVPTLMASIVRGTIGFTLVSLAGFAPWVLAGRWFYRNVGEAGLYAVCALVFIAFSGLLLHPLIIGPGSLRKFYQVFSLAFLGYSIAWTVGWMALGGHLGSIVGLLAGTVVMGALLAYAFAVVPMMLRIVAALFITNAAGYFLGDLAHRVLPGAPGRAAWGLCYGLGFGAGIGFAFYLCQSAARKLLGQR